MTLNDLFKKDPLDLTNDDIEFIVQQLREKREVFLKEERKTKSSRKAANKASAQAIDLKEIFG